jgi:hypothetical protein
MNQAFIDLDELVALCRDKLSKQFIQEAVNCYRAGAYRSCIVATWNAVVFDFIHKMRELELSGNSEAINQLQKFEKLSSDKNVKGLWQFEKDIPKLSLEKFELISHPEKPHIERLFEDRSLCAHPSMASLEEPFEATAELARCHLRSAVMYLLQRPPVQGRSACNKILQRIQLETFPKDPELATQYFKQGLLAGARPSLIKDILVNLTIKLLTDNCSEDERERHFSALNAISNLYLQQTRDILNEKLSRFIEEVNDANLDKAIIYLRSVKAWDRLSEPCQIRINIFIQNLEILENRAFGRRRPSLENVKILLNATRLGFLKETIAKKLDLPFQDLILLKDFCQNELHDMSIQEFVHPLLEKNVAQADLEDLISIKLDGNDRLNEKIMPYLSEKIKDASLVDLIEARRKDKSLNDFVESFLQIKIDDARLDELLESLEWTTRRDREEIMNKFENRTPIQI